MKKRIRLGKIEQGVCPYCGCSLISYGCSEHEDDMMEMYPATCTECGRDFEEWYSLNFVGMNVGDNCDIVVDEGEEGTEIEMDVEPSIEKDVWNVEDYLEEIDLGREELTVREMELLLVDKGLADTYWNYPLNEMEYCINDVGGKFVIVKFPTETYGTEYRICQL